jgi:hypothetical protein
MLPLAHPANHLYTTLHYYLMSLQERPELKKKLVATVMGRSGVIDGWVIGSVFPSLCT